MENIRSIGIARMFTSSEFFGGFESLYLSGIYETFETSGTFGMFRMFIISGYYEAVAFVMFVVPGIYARYIKP